MNKQRLKHIVKLIRQNSFKQYMVTVLPRVHKRGFDKLVRKLETNDE